MSLMFASVQSRHFKREFGLPLLTHRCVALADAPGQEQTSFAAGQSSDFIKHVRA
jgi:hypothetical protein